MYPIAMSNSIKKTVKIGDSVYDGGAWKCRVECITTVNDDNVYIANISEIKSVSLTISDPRFPIKAFEEVQGKMVPTEMPFHQIFLKKTDAVAFSESVEASWDAYNRFSYETTRPYKISKRKYQVTLRMLPASSGTIDLIHALQACRKYTFTGNEPYAFVILEKECRVFFENRYPLIIPYPNYITRENFGNVLSLGLGKKLATDIRYEHGIIYYL